MSPRNKNESGPKWAIINENFPLTAEENAIVNKHDAVWKGHCSGPNIDTMTLELAWKSITMGAEYGDDEALEKLRTFGSLESYVRFRRAEALGIRRKFDRENCGLFVETHAIASRLRGIFEKLLKQYREGGEDERKLLGLPAVVNDDATALMERTINSLFKVESYHPTDFEVLGNHVELVELEEEQP